MSGTTGISICAESVQALKDLASSLPEAIEMANTAASNLETAFDEQKDNLGEFSEDIKKIIETIGDAQKKAGSNVTKLQTILVKAAVAMQKILDNKITVNHP